MIDFEPTCTMQAQIYRINQIFTGFFFHLSNPFLKRSTMIRDRQLAAHGSKKAGGWRLEALG